MVSNPDLISLAEAMIPTSYAIVGGIVLAILVSLPVLNRIRKGGLASQMGIPVRPVHPVIVTPTGANAATTGISAIQLIRSRVGHRPRSFDPSLSRYLHIDPPPWMGRMRSDELRGIYTAQQNLRQDGRIVWAAVVQANSLLFRPGANDHPASVLWSEDPAFDTQPKALAAIASQLFTLKGTSPSNPELARFARLLTNERERGPRLPVPRQLTGDRAVYHSSLMFVRKHLPQGYLAGSLVPVWADTQPTGLLLLVPAAYWPDTLMDQWKPR